MPLPQPLAITLETAKHLTVKQEIALLSVAFERAPSPRIRASLATLLTIDDDLEAVVALLTDQDDLGVGEQILLGQALLSRETAEGDEAARVAADRAVAASRTSVDRAAALALLGKAEMRRGDIDSARKTLSEALALDPHNKDACKRLAAIALGSGDSDEVLSLYDDLHAKGAAHSRLFAARALAHAQRGDGRAARSMIGADRFMSAQRLTPPAGWDSIETFNTGLAAELLAHPQLRYERYGSASELTWRIDWLPHRAAPLTCLLLEAIAEAVGEHVARLATADHPWAAAQPGEALLRSWCVITDGDGFENWHVHQFGWLSGAYYVRVPDEIAYGDGNAGNIAIGLPEDLVGEEAAAAYGTQLIRPKEGLLLIFPSHTYHRTYPHRAKERRICVAFDIKPLGTRSGSL